MRELCMERYGELVSGSVSDCGIGEGDRDNCLHAGIDCDISL